MNLGTYNNQNINLDFAHNLVLKNKHSFKSFKNSFGYIKNYHEFDEDKNYFFCTQTADKRVIYLTSSKLRGLLTLVNNLYSKVYYDDSNDISKITDDIEYLDVKFAYEAGRDATVKKFLDESLLRQLLPNVIKKNSKKYFIDYCKYFEAYVAYMKFEGMGD